MPGAGRDGHAVPMRSLALLAATLLLAFPASASAQTTTTAGISETRVDLGGLTVGGVGVDDLGSVRALATTAEAVPAALARATLPGGQRLEVTSADGTDVPAQTVDVAGLGTVSVAGLVADADADSAVAAVDALSAELTPLGLELGTQSGGLGASIDQAGTVARNGVALSGLDLSLSDLLGSDVLAELPLGVLLDLSGGLGLDLGGIGAGQLDEVLSQLDAGRTLAGQVDAARAAVEDARAAVGSAQEDLAVAEAQAEDAAAAVDAKQAELAGVACAVLPAVCSELEAELAVLQAQAVSAQELVSAAAAAVDAAQAAAAPLEAALDDLADQAAALLDRLTALLDGVGALDLQALLEQLRDGIAGVELLAVDSLALAVETSAAAGSSAASASCDVSGVRVAAQAVAVDACDALADVLDTAAGDILTVLEALPVELPADVVSVTAPALRVSEADEVRDGAHVAEASVTGLGLDVASLDLSDVAVADLLTPVTSFVDQALPDLGALPGVDTAAVTAALDGLLAQVQALPAGDLAGLSTPGVAMAPAGAVAASQFTAAATGPGVHTPTGQVATPGAPTGQGALPATGGGIGAGILLLGSGLGAVAWLRRGRRV